MKDLLGIIWRLLFRGFPNYTLPVLLAAQGSALIKLPSVMHVDVGVSRSQIYRNSQGPTKAKFHFES